MNPDNMIAVDPSKQWCEVHWAGVLESIMDKEEPINGFVATIEIFYEWLRIKSAQMGDAFPKDGEARRMMALFEEDAPLCCAIGQDKLDAILSTCVLPERYRRMDVQTGHLLHAQERLGVIIGMDPSEMEVNLN